MIHVPSWINGGLTYFYKLCRVRMKKKSKKKQHLFSCCVAVLKMKFNS